MAPIHSALVKSILEQYRSYEWTVQGFGMLRTKIGGVGRIHIWDGRLRVARVSDIHAHPWALRSTIVSGELINQRFLLPHDDRSSLLEAIQLPYMQSLIATGEGGGLKGESLLVRLTPAVPEFYTYGDSYKQGADEIHRTIPMDGTVTLLERTQGEPLQETYVFWPQGTRWVSAEPRPATPEEIEDVVWYALARWFDGH